MDADSPPAYGATAANDLPFLVSLMEDLARREIVAWLFGGWAEELLRIRPAGPHSDVDLLYPAGNFERIDALLQSHPTMAEIRQKRFSHKRAAEYRGVRVEFLLLEPEGDRHVTRFFEGRYVHTWPADTLAGPSLEVGPVRLPVASAASLCGYRDAHSQIMSVGHPK